MITTVFIHIISKIRAVASCLQMVLKSFVRVCVYVCLSLRPQVLDKFLVHQHGKVTGKNQPAKNSFLSSDVKNQFVCVYS